MRTHLLATSAVLLFTLSAYGCSGSSSGEDAAEEESPTVPPRTGEGDLGGGSADPAPASDPAPAPSAVPDGGAPENEGDGGGGGGDGGGGGNGGGGGTGGGGGGGTGGTKCISGSVQETEPNNTAQTANTIPNASGSFCGTLSSSTDVDFVTFTLPANASYLAFGAEYTRVGADFDVTVNNKTFKIGGAPEFVPGGKYVIKAFTTGKDPLAYRIDVQIKQ